MSNLNKYITSHWQIELGQSLQPLGQSHSQGQARNIYESDYSFNNNIILLIFLTIRAICMLPYTLTEARCVVAWTLQYTVQQDRFTIFLANLIQFQNICPESYQICQSQK